jgi:hypothetical protein
MVVPADVVATVRVPGMVMDGRTGFHGDIACSELMVDERDKGTVGDGRLVTAAARVRIKYHTFNITKIHYIDIHFMKWTILILCTLYNYYKNKYLRTMVRIITVLFYIIL